MDADPIQVYDGYAETLFPDGYHVGLRGEGRRRELAEPARDRCLVGPLQP